ncbi:MAG: vitamin B12 dependent-methionine synthase activation domain-containing protein [Lutispora sp.]
MNIDRMEVLRYLGYKNQSIDEAMENLIYECIAEIREVMKKSFVYNIYDIEKQGDKVILKDTNLIFQSRYLRDHLQNSDRCALMAATLGIEVDKRIGYYSRLNLTKGIVMDACATAAIEAVCDEVQEEIKEMAQKAGYNITDRYSPGYGDLSITHQKAIIEVLKAHIRIGLTVNKNYIMIPRKSVTALIGLHRGEENVVVDKCSRCKEKNCMYRKCGDANELEC